MESDYKEVCYMGFWFFKKKDDELSDDRMVKEPDLSEFIVPVFVNPQPIHKSDMMLVEKLKQEFLELGVINEEYDGEDDRLNDDEANSLVEFFEEVNSHAKSERDFHEDVVFDEMVYEGLNEYEETIIFDSDGLSYEDQIRNLTSEYDEDEYF